VIGARWPRLLAAGVVLLIAACASTGKPAPRVDPTAPLTGAEGSYRLLLPPGYPDGAPYPVLYFLHDFFGDSRVLWKSGAAEQIERQMAAGRIAPMIVVAPDGDKGYWADSYDGRRRFERWVTDGLRRRIEADLPVAAERSARAVAGISMGGYGAAKLALKHPELYSAAGSLSGALTPLTWEGVESAPFFIRPALKRVFGRSAQANNLADNDLVRLLERPWPSEQPRPRFLLRCGTEDKYRLDEAASRFHAALEDAGFESRLVLEAGGHNWRYWRQSAVELVAWHGERFVAQAAERAGEPAAEVSRTDRDGAAAGWGVPVTVTVAEQLPPQARGTGWAVPDLALPLFVRAAKEEDTTDEEHP
jgi:S-formylglutathione hydrolase FrmB